MDVQLRRKSVLITVFHKKPLLTVCLLWACACVPVPNPPLTHSSMSIQKGYSDVNGLRMYYEIHAPETPHQVPLVLIHGGGSTIETTFGRVLPLLSQTRRRSGAPEVFWEWMQTGTLAQMPQALKDAYRAADNDDAALQNMFNKCAARMTGFADWPKEFLTDISAPTLLIGGDADVMTVEHLTKMYRLIPNCQLAIFPGGHGAYLGEITTLSPSHAYHDYFVPVVAQFLE